MLIPRDDQEKVIERFFSWFSEHPVGMPLFDLAPSAGKSLIIAEICKRAISKWPKTRILILAPTTELVSQVRDEILGQYSKADLGIYSASHGQKVGNTAIVIATIGSITGKHFSTGAFDICLADEAHFICSTQDVGRYRALVKDYTSINPSFRISGFSGSCYTPQGYQIHGTPTSLFTHIAASITTSDLLAINAIVPLVTLPTSFTVSSEGLNIDSKTGDFKINEVSKVMNRASVTEKAVNDFAPKLKNLGRFMVFCCDIEHSILVNEQINKTGIKCAVVHSKVPKAIRKKTIEDFRSGKIQGIVNPSCLTVGFSVKEVMALVNLRNTRSWTLWKQMTARGIRECNAIGKTHCYWLDYSDATDNMPAIDKMVSRPRPEKKSGKSPVKQCGNDQCGKIDCHASARFCTACGFEFVIVENIMINTEHTDTQVMSIIKEPPKKYEVKEMLCRAHTSYSTGNQSLRISYYTTSRQKPIEDYLHFNQNKAWKQYKKACKTWLELRGNSPPPSSVTEAMARITELQQPDSVEAFKNDDFFDFVGYRYHQPKPETANGTNTTATTGYSDEYKSFPELRMVQSF